MLLERNLGLLDFDAALAVQHETHARVVAGLQDSEVLFVEHPPVLTLGRHADPKFLKVPEEFFAARGIAVVPIDRGGEVTAHEPGQLVMYPIVRLADFGLLPKRYVELLERAVINTLANFGIVATIHPEHPGVWVGREKICAVGIRIKDRVSLHGIALNVANDLKLFDMIVPCGIAPGREKLGVTSMTRFLAEPVAVAAVRQALVAALKVELAATRNPRTVASPSMHSPMASNDR